MTGFAVQVLAVGGQQVAAATVQVLIALVVLLGPVAMAAASLWLRRHRRQRLPFPKEPVTHVMLGALPGEDGADKAYADWQAAGVTRAENVTDVLRQWTAEWKRQQGDRDA